MTTNLIEQCQEFAGERELSEGEMANFQNLVRLLAVAVTDCFLNLASVDQALLSPPGDAIDCLVRMDQSPETPTRKGKS